MESRQTPLRGLTLALVTIALALGNFMEVLDTTIANVAVPHIAGDLAVSANQGIWVITSYAVANAISLLLSGWLAQRFGQVRVFVWAVALFTIASALCGMAISFQMLLVARVLQGAVAGLMVPLSQALLMSSYPENKRGLAMAFWAMTVVIAPILGPILGGWITDNIGWPWIFYVNLPVGITVALLAWQLLAQRETPRRKQPLDGVGFGLVVVWVGALQILLDKGNDLDWFHSDAIIVLALAATIGAALFTVWELTDKHPLVRLDLFRLRNFRAGTLAVSLGFGAYFGSVVLLPLWLQTQMGYTATWAGLALAPSGVLAFAFSPVVGKLLERVDPRIFASAALLVYAISSFMRAGFATTADFATFAAPQWLFGAGTATFFAPLLTIAMGGLDPEQTAFAAGLLNFLRLMAGSFSAALTGTFWERRTALHHSQLVEHVSAYAPQANAVADQLGRVGLDGQPALAQINGVVTQQASTLAANDLFWFLGWLLVLLVGMVWLAAKPPVTAPVVAH